MFIRSSLVVFALALSGCTTQTQIPYVPQELGSKPDAMAQLERVLHEQDAAYSAGDVSVTDKYFTTTDRMTRYAKNKDGSGVSVQPGRYVYYDDIGVVDYFERHKALSSKKSYFVRIYDKVNYLIFTYYNHDPAKATQFMDSIATLQH